MRSTLNPVSDEKIDNTPLLLTKPASYAIQMIKATNKELLENSANLDEINKTNVFESMPWQTKLLCWCCCCPSTMYVAYLMSKMKSHSVDLSKQIQISAAETLVLNALLDSLQNIQKEQDELTVIHPNSFHKINREDAIKQCATKSSDAIDTALKSRDVKVLRKKLGEVKIALLEEPTAPQASIPLTQSMQ